ncbi:MAG: group 1 truncated hemoglobin [bacterium]
MRKIAFSLAFLLMASPLSFGASAAKKEAASHAQKKNQKTDAKEQKKKAAPPAAKKATHAASAEKSLYNRLGGKDTLVEMVDQWIANVAGDSRISKFFVKADLPSFKAKLVDQICQASGGPCKYTGKSMKDAHQGMGLSDAHFSAFLEDLAKALDRLKVGKAEKDELLSLLTPLRQEVVEKKAAAK